MKRKRISRIHLLVIFIFILCMHTCTPTISSARSLLWNEYLTMEAPEYDYVNLDTSNVDNSDPADKGSHGNFTAQQYADSFYDTLTEENTGGAGGDWGITSSAFTSSATHATYRYMGGASPDIDNMRVTKLHICYSGTGTVAIALYTEGTLTDPTGATKRTEAYNVAVSSGWNEIDVPDYDWEKNTITWIGWCHGGGSVYYSSNSGDAGDFQSARGRWNQGTPSDADETQPMPATPGSGSFNNYWYAVYVEYETTNYELDLEVQWTSANYTRANEELCIKTGTTAAEDIKVYVWNVTGSSWHLVFDDLSAGNWNNASVTDYLTSSTFTVRFLGGTETSDTNQDSWQIDCALLHTWMSTGSVHANFTYTPLVPYVNYTVTFDASASTSENGIICYEWNYGDGTSGTGMITDKIYTEAGNYTVTLTVTDNEEAQDFTSKLITVIPDPEGPVIDLYNQRGGQGPNEPSEDFAPGEMVELTALLAYLEEPVEYKLVAFEVTNAIGEVVLDRSSMTDADGLARINFTLRGECLPEVFGTWSALAVASVSEQIANDTLTFYVTGAYLDVYTQKPEPHSGKGLNEPSDAFAPQEEIILYAEAHYDCEPIEYKFVAFEVIDPNGETVIDRSNATDQYGIATTRFRVESNATFGIYTVYATVEILGKIANDTLTFRIGWIVEILGVETVDATGITKSIFTRGEHMYFNLTVKNIAFVSKTATFTIVVYDAEDVPIGHVALQNWVVLPGISQFFIIDLQIPDWTYTGIATVYANAYTDLPVTGGVSYCPEISVIFTIVPS